MVEPPLPGSLNYCVEKSPLLTPGGPMHGVPSPPHFFSSHTDLVVGPGGCHTLDLKSSCMFSSGNPSFLSLNCHSTSLDLVQLFFLQILTEIPLSEGNFLTQFILS